MTNNKLTDERLVALYAEIFDELKVHQCAEGEEGYFAVQCEEVMSLIEELQERRKADDASQNLSKLYHAQEKRLFKLAQRIKGPSFDKYAYSPSQAIDVLESAVFGGSTDVDHAAALHEQSKQ